MIPGKEKDSWKKIVLTRRKGFLEENRVDEEKRIPGRKSSIHLQVKALRMWLPPLSEATRAGSRSDASKTNASSSAAVVISHQPMADGELDR
eukprot:scaffold7640_cov153-Isochrysis_galbana.AAC.3